MATKKYIDRKNRWFYIEPALFFGAHAPRDLLRGMVKANPRPILIIMGEGVKGEDLGGLLSVIGRRIKPDVIGQESLGNFLRDNIKKRYKDYEIRVKDPEVDYLDAQY